MKEISSKSSPNVGFIDFEARVKELVSLRDPENHYLVLYPSGEMRLDGDHPQVLLSGSFNPLHEGHVGLLEEASKEEGEKTKGFELAIRNADKGYDVCSFCCFWC